MSVMKVGVVGTGGIYNLAHGPAWKRIPEAQVIATCDIVKERAEKASADAGVQRSYASMKDMLADDGIELVDICTPHPSHADLAIQALETGRHVICEKPMAMNEADAARMIKVAQAKDRHLYIGHTRRFDRRWIEVKRQIQSGRIGEPVAVRWNERSWAGFGADSWRWDPENGGVLMDLGVHVADLFCWLLAAEPTEVFCKTRSVRPEAKVKGCADFALVQMSFAGKKQGLMELSWAHPKAYAPFYCTLEVIGTAGKLTFSDRDAGPMTVIKNDMEVPRYSPLLSTYPESFVSELEHFVRRIEGQNEARITPQDAFRAVKVMTAALSSAASGKPVALEGNPPC